MRTRTKADSAAPAETPKRGRGRPEVPAEDRKSNTLRIRLTQAQRRAFEEAAGGTDVSTWLRDLAEREVLRLRKARPTPSAAPTPPASRDTAAPTEGASEATSRRGDVTS